MQHPAMTIQGVIFKQSMVKPPVETPDMPILPEPPPSQVAKTYLNAGVTPEGYHLILERCERVTPQELLQEKFKRSPQRTVLRKLRQHNIVQQQIDSGVSGNDNPPEETKTQRCHLQLLNYASRRQTKLKPARSCRSPPLASTSNDTTYRPATRPSDNQQPPAFIALTVHTCPTTAHADQLTTTHSGASTGPLHSMTQASSLSLSSERKDYQPRQMTQPTATLQSSSWQPGLTETDPTRTQWKSMRQVHSHIANRLFPHGHHSTIDTMPEESVLMWTLFQPILDTSWRRTYAWNDQLDGLVETIDESNFQTTYQQLSKFFEGANISKALWSPTTDHLPIPKLRHGNSPQNIQPPYANRAHVPLTKLLDDITKEISNQQLRTSKQQKAPQHTQQEQKNNCDTRQPTIAPVTFLNLHDTAQDGATTHPVRLAKQYTFDAVSGDQSLGLIAAILQFLCLNMGGTSSKRFSNQCAGRRLWNYWYPPREKPATLPKWGQWWVEAILQRFWNMAWDTLTHRNIEDGAKWAWPAHTIARILK